MIVNSLFEICRKPSIYLPIIFPTTDDVYIIHIKKINGFLPLFILKSGVPFEAKGNKSEKGTVHPTLKRASEDILRFAKNGAGDGTRTHNSLLGRQRL